MATARQLRAIGASVRGDIVTLYRGADVPASSIRKLRFGDYLSPVRTGPDCCGNEGASGYGKTVVRLRLPISKVKIVNGAEVQYIGEESLRTRGGKYPLAVYRAYNEAEGSNLVPSQIDALAPSEVRLRASMAMPGGREEFERRVLEFWRRRGEAPLCLPRSTRPGESIVERKRNEGNDHP